MTVKGACVATEREGPGAAAAGVDVEGSSSATGAGRVGGSSEWCHVMYPELPPSQLPRPTT